MKAYRLEVCLRKTKDGKSTISWLLAIWDTTVMFKLFKMVEANRLLNLSYKRNN